MPKLTLYKVGARGRVQLDGHATDGDFYTVAKDEDGVITLSPVDVQTTSTKRTASDTDAD